MSLINTPIGPQNYELVLDRIGEILVDELNNQVLLTYDQDLNVTVYKERFVPFQPAELPAVNVMLFKGDYSDQTQIETQCVYRFIIECTGIADSEDGVDPNNSRGDTLSMIRIQKLMGKIRAILENPVYKTLGFTAPRIGYRRIEGLEFMKHPHQDANSVSIGRLMLAVQVNETTSLITPVLLGTHQTTVRLASTDRGFIWTLEQD
jgi:hypothetical protein